MKAVVSTRQDAYSHSNSSRNSQSVIMGGRWSVMVTREQFVLERLLAVRADKELKSA
jgi:hypothetical protein